MLKRLLSILGPSGSRHWSQNGEDIVLERLFKGKTGGLYVDAGAHHPFRYSNTYMLHKRRGWSGINIDAKPENIEAFTRHRPDDVNIAAFLSDEAGETVQFKNFQGGLGSTGVPVERISEGRRHRIESQESLTTVTLESILCEHAPDKDIDLLDVDVEGFDFRVLRSLDWSRREVSVVCVEDFSFQLARPSKIAEFMFGKGYRRVSHCYDTSIFVSEAFAQTKS